MPTLPAATQKNDSILVSTTGQNEVSEEIYTTGGKWEDEEERRFFEDIQDLRDFVPKSVLGFTETGQVTQDTTDSGSIKDDLDRERREREERERREKEEREEKERLAREKAEKAKEKGARGIGTSGVRGVRGTRASMRAASAIRGTSTRGMYFIF